MTSDPRCGEFRELAPELALGIVTGEERARALEHVSGCAGCREFLAELSDVADGLVSLAPSHEPPVGFETRVMEEIHRPPKRNRWRRAAVALGAAALIAALSAGAVLQATEEERELGEDYRETLAVANGEYLTAAVLRGPEGGEVGHVFGYQGSPSWVFVAVSNVRRDGPYKIVFQGKGGRSELGWMTLKHGAGSWGGAVPGDFHGAEGLVLRSGAVALRATF